MPPIVSKAVKQPIFYQTMMNNILIRSAVLTFFGAVPLFAEDFRLNEQTVVHFASVAEGKQLLRTPDRYLKALSPFDRQSRLEVERDVSDQEFAAFIEEHVREWSKDEIAQITAVFESLKPKLAGLRLGLPAAIWLIKTSGREEGNAAYCRRHAIVLPQAKISQPATSLERLLTHELFHIVSSHNAELRARCYGLIGFQIVPEIAPPAALRDLKITNPDAPLLDSIIDLKVDGQSVTATPFLFATGKFDQSRGGPFFKYLSFKLLVVERGANGWQAIESEGKPRLLDPATTADFHKQIGGNTQYILHPDEILADNFVHLVQKTRDLRTPELVEKLGEVLRATVP